MPSDALSTLLQDVAEAIRAGNLDAAEDSLDEVEAIYDELDTSERIEQRKAVVGRDSTDTDSAIREQLDEFAQAVNASDLGRAAVLTAAALYLANPGVRDADTIASKVSEQASHESTLVDLEASVDDALSSVDLPPVLLVATADLPDGVQPKGTSFDVSATVENVGDADANAVSLSQESGATVSPGSVSLGTLSPDADGSATFTVSGAQSGEFELRLRATGDPGQADQRTERFRIVDKRTAIERARESVGDLVQLVEESDELHARQSNGLLSKLENADAKLEDASGFAEQDRPRQANNMLNAASRNLGAFLNQVDGLRGGGENGSGNGNGSQSTLSAQFARTLTTLAEGCIDQVSLALDADI